MTEREQKLVEDNIRLAVHIAKRWFGRTKLENDEVVSAAYYGLVKAVVSFDPDRGFCFTTYAGRCIENEIRMEIRKLSRRRPYISIDAEVPGTEDLTYADMLPDRKKPFDHIESEMWLTDRIKGLDDRSRNDIRIRILFPDKTQAELAELIGISQSMYSRRLKKAAEKMMAG